MTDIFLILAGVLAGAMNALAGGGSYVTLPALIAVGVPSVAANSTSTLALYPGGLASSWVYRDGLAPVCGIPVILIAALTLVGGFVGSLLLLITPSSVFDAILPWLLLVATIMLAGGKRVGPFLRKRFHASSLTVVPIQFLLGIYGGYFGGAVGLMMIAVWSVLDGADFKTLSPMRTLMVSAANTVAVAVFVVAGAIAWRQCLPLLAGAIVGGWLGARVGRKLPSEAVRVGTVALAVVTTIVFFVRAFG